MTVAVLAVQQASLTGLAPAFANADAAGDSFANDGNTFLHVRNGGAAAITVTIPATKPCNQGFTHDVQVSVPAGGERIIGPFATGRFNDDQGRVSVQYSAVTSVTVAAVRVA